MIGQMIDWQIDLALVLQSFSERERRILDLRRQGCTFQEIGHEVALSKQRVSELYHGAIRRLNDIFRDRG